jgi:outer membrane protein
MAFPFPIRSRILVTNYFNNNFEEVVVKKTFLALIAFAGLTSLMFSQGALKIGFVNSEKIINELPEAKDAQQKLQDLVGGWQDQIKSRSDSLQAKYEEFQRQSNMLNESAKQAKLKALTDEDNKLKQYQADKQQELAAQRDKFMKPITDKVMKAIEKVAKDKKLSFVFDKATDVPLLYADPVYDYTPDVLIYLKRGGK